MYREAFAKRLSSVKSMKKAHKDVKHLKKPVLQKPVKTEWQGK